MRFLTLRQSAGLIFLGILLAASILPQPFKGRMATFGAAHHLLHVCAFGTAFVLVAWQAKSWKHATVWALALCAFGAVLEVLETMIYRNRLEYFDIFANAVGVAVALVVRTAFEQKTDRLTDLLDHD